MLLIELLLASTWLLTHRRPLPGEAAIGNMAVTITTKLRAGGGENPYPKDATSTAKGEELYLDCSFCHGRQGDGKGREVQNVYPPPTNLLRAQTVRKSDGELFWITKNGLSFTAMPGYGKQLSDDEIWALVNYIRVLQADWYAEPE